MCIQSVQPDDLTGTLCDMRTAIRLIGTSVISSSYLCVCWVRGAVGMFKVYSNEFQVHHTVLSTIVTVLYVRALELNGTVPEDLCL